MKICRTIENFEVFERNFKKFDNLKKKAQRLLKILTEFLKSEV